MKAKIVGIVLVISLMGLILPGCTSKAQLNELEAQVGEKELQISELKGELSSKDDRLNELEAQLANLESELAKLSHDPTYDELMEFVAREKAKENWYSNSLNCTQAFLQNAREAAIRGYLVMIWTKAGGSWPYTAFWVTDRKDWVFILPNTCEEVKLIKGKKYHELNGFPFFIKYQEVMNASPFFGVDDTIMRIIIFN